MMKTREAWDDSRDCLIHALTAKCSPATFMCCECNTVVDAIIRCSDCGPWAYFCVDCCNQQHKHVIMHVAEMWTVGGKIICRSYVNWYFILYK
jgi:hypothetical protein